MRRYCSTCGEPVKGVRCPVCGDDRLLTEREVERLRLVEPQRGRVARRRRPRL